MGIQESIAQQTSGIIRAAEAGNAQAQFELGKMYNSGRGQRRDVQEAVRWFREAAKQGHVKAFFHLGVMLEKGRGVC